MHQALSLGSDAVEWVNRVSLALAAVAGTLVLLVAVGLGRT